MSHVFAWHYLCFRIALQVLTDTKKNAKRTERKEEKKRESLLIALLHSIYHIVFHIFIVGYRAVCKKQIIVHRKFLPTFLPPIWLRRQYSEPKELNTDFAVILRLSVQRVWHGDVGELALVGRNLACYEFLKIAAHCSLESSRMRFSQHVRCTH